MNLHNINTTDKLYHDADNAKKESNSSWLKNQTDYHIKTNNNKKIISIKIHRQFINHF